MGVLRDPPEIQYMENGGGGGRTMPWAPRGMSFEGKGQYQ